jgi:addiction module HigA family antidote
LSYLLNGKQSISPEMALRLAKAFPNTTPHTWMALQERYDLAKAEKITRAGEVLPLAA